MNSTDYKEESVPVPRRMIHELAVLARPYNKDKVDAIVQQLLEGKLISRDKCIMGADGKHKFITPILQDEDTKLGRNIMICRTRRVCEECGYVYELISQPFTIDKGSALRDYQV